MTSWLDFWNGARFRPYAGPRHCAAHFAAVAEDVRALIPRTDAVVVDYGPGPALSAARVAEACGALILCEAAEAGRAALTGRFASVPGIVVETPATLARRGSATVDLFVVNSVVQYLTPDEMTALLSLARRLLRPEGRLVVGDVIPPEANLVADVRALLGVAWRKGFLLEALTGLVLTALSPYRRFRRKYGLRRFAESEMRDILRRAGFSVEVLPINVGGDPTRVTYAAAPLAAANSDAANSSAAAPGRAEGPLPVRAERP